MASQSSMHPSLSSVLSLPPGTLGRVLVPPTSSLSQHPPTSSSHPSGPTSSSASTDLGPTSSTATLEANTASYHPSLTQADEYDLLFAHPTSSSSSATSSSTGPPPPGPPPPSQPTTAPSSFAQALDEAYNRYIAAIDAIAAKYANPTDDQDADEVEVRFDDLVGGMVQGLEPDAIDEPVGTGEEEAEVGEGDGEDEDLSGGLPRNKGTSSTVKGGGHVFRGDGAPTWCWVEPDTSFSSDIISCLLQNSASLTPSLSSATHIVLSPNPTTSSSTSSLSVLHRSILEQKLPQQHIVTFDWVRDCVTTGVRLRETGYEVRWAPAARETPRPIVVSNKGKGRAMGGWSSTAPGRMERKEIGRRLLASSSPDKSHLSIASPSRKPAPDTKHARPDSPDAPPPAPPLSIPRPSQLLLPLRPPPLLSSHSTLNAPIAATPPPPPRLTKISHLDPPKLPLAAPLPPATKRPRVLGAGMSRLNKVPRLLSSIRGVEGKDARLA